MALLDRSRTVCGCAEPLSWPQYVESIADPPASRAWTSQTGTSLAQTLSTVEALMVGTDACYEKPNKQSERSNAVSSVVQKENSLVEGLDVSCNRPKAQHKQRRR